jgi:hypothetical protein
MVQPAAPGLAEHSAEKIEIVFEALLVVRRGARSSSLCARTTSKVFSQSTWLIRMTRASGGARSKTPNYLWKEGRRDLCDWRQLSYSNRLATK